MLGISARTPHVVLEATYGWYQAVDVLQAVERGRVRTGLRDRRPVGLRSRCPARAMTRRSEATRTQNGMADSSGSSTTVPEGPNRSLVSTLTPHLPSTACIRFLRPVRYRHQPTAVAHQLTQFPDIRWRNSGLRLSPRAQHAPPAPPAGARRSPANCASRHGMSLAIGADRPIRRTSAASRTRTLRRR